VIKLRILLISNTKNIRRGTGVARFTLHMYEGLKKLGIDTELLVSEPYDIPFGKLINHSLILPAKIIKSIPNYTCLHFLTPAAAIYSSFFNRIRPCIVTFHELSFLSHETHGFHYYTFFAPLWYKLATKASRIIVPTMQTRDDLVKYLKISSSKITVINYAISDYLKPLEDPFKRLEGKEEYNIGYLGTLGRKKRVDYAIKAFYIFRKKYPNVKAKFLICGRKDMEYQKLKTLVKTLKLEKEVIFLGFVKSELDAYNLFDIFVFPSEWEGLGYPILEAQKCGTPVVIRALARIPLESRLYAVKAYSTEDMADKIYLLLTDINYRNKIVQAGLEYANKFTVERMAMEYIKAYESAY
jgi:glycosyltransferase involved in cell wall biosynthesis